ncbi:MAG: hypothetical protein R3A10_14865 [Caldilineaceae bacterium]
MTRLAFAPPPRRAQDAAKWTQGAPSSCGSLRRRFRTSGARERRRWPRRSLYRGPSFSDQSIRPATLEAKCLYDADKLDSMGAIGVARAFAFAGARDNRLWIQPHTQVPPHPDRPRGADYTPVHEYVYKLARLLDTLHTPTARAIGVARHAFMLDFFTQLDREMAGEMAGES